MLKICLDQEFNSKELYCICIQSESKSIKNILNYDLIEQNLSIPFGMKMGFTLEPTETKPGFVLNADDKWNMFCIDYVCSVNVEEK